MTAAGTLRPGSDQATSRSRRRLQVTLGVLAAIPFASGLAGMLAGRAALPGGGTEASVDSELSYTNAFWFATAPLVWSQLPRVDQESPALRAVLGTIFVGGIARLLSWRRTGRPHPVFVGALGLELVAAPALAAWHLRLSRSLEDEGHQGGIVDTP